VHPGGGLGDGIAAKVNKTIHALFLLKIFYNIEGPKRVEWSGDWQGNFQVQAQRLVSGTTIRVKDAIFNFGSKMLNGQVGKD